MHYYLSDKNKYFNIDHYYDQYHNKKNQER